MRLVQARVLAITSALLFAFSPVVSAQDLASIEQGTKPYGAYHGGDIDSVSMVNGSLQVRIPLISFPQRGGRLKANISLMYQGPYYTHTDSCNGNPDPTCIPTWYRYQLTFGGQYS